MRYRLRTLLIVLTLGPIVLASGQEPNNPVNEFESPASVFKAFREARSQRNFRRYFSFLTPEALNNAVFDTFFQSAESQSKEAKSICEKYIDDKKMKSEIEKEQLRNAGKKTEFNLRDVLSNCVQDKIGFCADISAVFVNENNPLLPLGELRNLVVTDDTAKGQSTTTLWHLSSANGVQKKVFDDIETTVVFRRIDGRWLIDRH